MCVRGRVWVCVCVRLSCFKWKWICAYLSELVYHLFKVLFDFVHLCNRSRRSRRHRHRHRPWLSLLFGASPHTFRIEWNTEFVVALSWRWQSFCEKSKINYFWNWSFRTNATILLPLICASGVLLINANSGNCEQTFKVSPSIKNPTLFRFHK